MAKQAAVKTGISLGLMLPSPQTGVLEGHCKKCGDLIRAKVNEVTIGRGYMMNVRCDCGTQNKIASVAKELDA